jgi:hypothetical protein
MFITLIDIEKVDSKINGQGGQSWLNQHPKSFQAQTPTHLDKTIQPTDIPD